MGVLQARAAELDGPLDRTLTPQGVALHAAAATGQEDAVPQIIMQQPRLCVLFKPPGWTVSVVKEEDQEQEEVSIGDGPSEHPSKRSMTNNDIEQHEGGALQEWLMSVLGADFKIAFDVNRAHGLVHRLDRDTSGAILWAHSYDGYFAARLQFAARSVRKHYVCLCSGFMRHSKRFLEGPLLETDASDHATISVVAATGRPSRTEVLDVKHLVCPRGYGTSLAEVSLHTGRRHQIRAHMAAEGHALIGDATYGGNIEAWCPRIFLHACRFGIDIGDGLIGTSVPIPADLRQALSYLHSMDISSRVQS